MKRLDGTEVVWELFECDDGCRWSQVKGGICDEHDGGPCGFSGCKAGHRIHKRGETTDSDRASGWFRDVHRDGKAA
jgi:hypothetical protein